ncbi:MAG: LysR family transcriptional regulator [Labrenzia sp.]
MASNVNFRQLQTFVEVIRSGSISDAGRKLGRSQPAVSAMIASLEKEIGFDLFERQRRRLIAKPEAFYFLEEAEQLLSKLEQTTRTLQEIGNLKKGTLKIACNPASSIGFVPKIINQFISDKEEMELSVMMRSSSIITDWIASQQYDIGIAETPDPRQSIRSIDYSFSCVCAMAPSAPLADKNLITPSDLDGQPMALLSKNHPQTQAIMKIFSESGAETYQRFEFGTMLPALQLTLQGKCYTICDSFSAITFNDAFSSHTKLVFKPFLPKLLLNMSLLFPSNRPQSMLAKHFERLLVSEIEELLSMEERIFDKFPIK